MLDIHVARDRAVRRAIDTGHMPNIDLIHTIQRTEGFRPCFGRLEGLCSEFVCRWHTDCMALADYRPSPSLAGGAEKVHRTVRTPPSAASAYRDGTPAAVGETKHAAHRTAATHALRRPTAAESPAPRSNPEQAKLVSV
jgi:hypothetical protein